MFPPLSAVTICWSFNYDFCLRTLQTTTHIAAAIACLTMPLTLYRARRQSSDCMVPFLLITSAFTLCFGLNQILAALTVWTEEITPSGLEILWSVTSAATCLVAAWAFHKHAGDLLVTRQELVSIRALAKTDPLTGLENRQGFNDGLEYAIRNSRGATKPSTLMLVDLDRFKNANDTYGHLVGDHILQRVAQILKRHARSSDCVARLGGDEFAIVWNQCDLETAKALAESIRQDISRLWLPQTSQETAIVTASIGLATVDPEVTATRMYEMTDRTLYVSKREGKNQVSWMPVQSQSSLDQEHPRSTHGAKTIIPSSPKPKPHTNHRPPTVSGIKEANHSGDDDSSEYAHQASLLLIANTYSSRNSYNAQKSASGRSPKSDLNHASPLPPEHLD